MGDQANAVDQRTQKPGKISLHPLKFEDALKGLLKTKPPEKGKLNTSSGQDARRSDSSRSSEG